MAFVNAVFFFLKVISRKKTMSLQVEELTRWSVTWNLFFLHECVDACRSTCPVSELTASVRVQVDFRIFASISQSTILLGLGVGLGLVRAIPAAELNTRVRNRKVEGGAQKTFCGRWEQVLQTILPWRKS